MILDRLNALERLAKHHENLLQEQKNLLQIHSAAFTRDVDPMSRTSQRFVAFLDQQLPELLRTVSDVHQQQNRIDADQENLKQSVPVALRTLRAGLENLNQSVPVALSTLRSDLQNLNQSVPVALSTLRARLEQQAGDFVGSKETLDYLLGRVEFVRRELMFELRYGASEKHSGEQSLISATRIMSPQKIEQARASGIRVNVGCGHVPLEGYLNVDRRELPGVDIVAEIDQLPFGEGELHEIHSAHMLEHFPQEQLRRSLLPYFWKLLAVGGVLRSIVPDAQAMIDHYADGSYPYSDLREVIYGGQDYDGDFHFNMFTPQSLTELLEEAGFKNVRVVEKGRQNGRCYEFEIIATKEGSAG